MSLTPEQGKKVRDYQQTFASETGQRVLEDLSVMLREKAMTYARGDTHQTAFNEGARWACLYIRRLIETKLDEPKPESAVTEQGA